MKTLIICGSITAAKEMLQVQKQLESMGYKVEVPEGVKRAELRARTEAENVEKAADKIKYDLIRGYFEKIKKHDIVLIVNPEKRGIKNYIGGNTLMEMAFAHVLNKGLYIYHGVPDMPYTAEILGMQPVVLEGELGGLELEV